MKHNCKYTTKDYILTGLFDENGTEIKVGDILRLRYGDQVFIEPFGSRTPGAFTYRPIGATSPTSSYFLYDLLKEAPFKIINTINNKKGDDDK